MILSSSASSLKDRVLNRLVSPKSDYEAVCEVAKKLGVYEKYTEGKTVDEWIKYGYEHSGVQGMVSWEELKEKSYYVVPTAPDWEKDPPA